MLNNIKKMVKETVLSFKNQFFQRSNLRLLLYYAVANFVILLLYSFLVSSLQSSTTPNPANIDLKPPIVTPPQSSGLSGLWIFILSCLLLPVTLLLEELGFRLLPMFFIRDLFHLDKLYDHWIWVFIVISGVWDGLIHQFNIVSATQIGAMIYFAVQLFSGICFAWIYSHKGLGASYAVHLGWDFFLVALTVVLQVI